MCTFVSRVYTIRVDFCTTVSVCIHSYAIAIEQKRERKRHVETSHLCTFNIKIVITNELLSVHNDSFLYCIILSLFLYLTEWTFDKYISTMKCDEHIERSHSHIGRLFGGVYAHTDCRSKMSVQCSIYTLHTTDAHKCIATLIF